MPNDAKLGLIAGLALVITVAVVYFRHDAPGSASPAAEPAASVKSAVPPPAVSAPEPNRIAKGKTTSLRHTVAEGDTLFSLAERYYGDRGRSTEIYQANRQVLRTPEELPPGTELLIPETAPRKDE